MLQNSAGKRDLTPDINVYEVDMAQAFAIMKRELSDRVNHSVFLVGPVGIGKSSLVQQWIEYREQSTGERVNYIDKINLIQKEPTDFAGQQIPGPDGRIRIAVPDHYPPSDAPGTHLIFFDEFDRAEYYKQTSALSILLDKEFTGYKFPRGTRVVAAGNFGSDIHTHVISDAAAQRATFIKARATLSGSLDWGLAHNWHPAVLAFLRANPDYLQFHTMPNWSPDATVKIFPSPRAYERLSTMLWAAEEERNAGNTDFDDMVSDISGYIGIQATTQFAQTARTLDSVPKLLEILSTVKGILNEEQDNPNFDAIISDRIRPIVAEHLQHSLAATWSVSYSMSSLCVDASDAAAASAMLLAYSQVTNGFSKKASLTAGAELLSAWIGRAGCMSAALNDRSIVAMQDALLPDCLSLQGAEN